jgi:hypothetical protein
MKPRSKRFVRPKITPFGEDADSAGVARVFVKVDAGTGPGVHVTFDLEITVRPGSARGTSHVPGAGETPCAALADEAEPDQQPDDPGEGPYIVTLFGKRVPVSQLKTRRRRFGRRR